MYTIYQCYVCMSERYAQFFTHMHTKPFILSFFNPKLSSFQFSEIDCVCLRDVLIQCQSPQQRHPLFFITFRFSRVHATLHLGLSVGPSVRRYVGRSVTFLNSDRFSHYCSCPTVRDWIAVYPASFFHIVGITKLK